MRQKFNVKVVIPDYSVGIIYLVYINSETKLLKTIQINITDQQNGG